MISRFRKFKSELKVSLKMFIALVCYELSSCLKEFKRLEKGHFKANYGFSWLYAICLFKLLLSFELQVNNFILFKKRLRWKLTEKPRYCINEPNAYSFRIIVSLERFKPSVYLNILLWVQKGIETSYKKTTEDFITNLVESNAN